MSGSVAQEIKEDLAQLGVRKSSRVLPLLSLAIVVLVIVLFVSKFGDNAVENFFVKACLNASIPTSQELAPLSPEQRSIRETCARTGAAGDQIAIKALIADKPVLKKEHLLQSFSTKNKAYDDLFQLLPRITIGFLKDYSAELARDAAEVGGNWLKTFLLVGLGAFFTGLIGMIYRRSFWSWFLAAALILAAIDWWAPFFPHRADVSGSSISILVFAMLQFIVLLFAFRLRRYSRNTSNIPAHIYNYVLSTVLALAALAIVFVPSTFWSNLPGILSWFSHWFVRLEAVFLLFVVYNLLRRSDAWNATSRKNIVVCLDGTTNTPDQLEFGRLAQTNVFKLFKMLKGDVPKVGHAARNLNASISKRYGDKQIGLYYSGVGNRFDYNPILQSLGGATGLGAADLVDRAYFDITRLYRPGDRIFIFGFSRGAAIARLLARAIDQRGAPNMVWALHLVGRDRTLWESRRDKKTDVPIELLGCWDTVAAFGIAKNFFNINFQKIDLFKDLTVPDNVVHAVHAVALDERREEFQPTLMEPDPTRPGKILEVWFSGDHANIGGGWATTKLSDVTLDFMLKKASSGYAHEETMLPGNEDWGIHLNAVNAAKLKLPAESRQPTPFELNPDPLGLLRQWFSALYTYKPRELPHHSIISESVFERMTKARPLYAPQSLFDLADELRAKRETVDAAVERLRETGSLSDHEKTEIVNFEAKLKLTRWPRDFPDHILFTKPGKVLENESGAKNTSPAAP